MPLEIFADRLDDVPEALRGDFAEHEGRFRFGGDNLDGLLDKQVGGLKSALKVARETNKELKSLGRTPAEIKAVLTNMESVAAATETFKTMLEQHQSNWNVEKNALQNEIKTARDHEHSIIHEAVLMLGLTKARATDEGLRFLPKLLENRFRVDGHEGKRSVTILDEAGAPMEIEESDGSKRAATFNDLFAETIREYPGAFEGTGAGGGTPPKSQQQSASKAILRADFNQLSPKGRAEKMADGYIVHD
jgi:hypothetical protein